MKKNIYLTVLLLLIWNNGLFALKNDTILVKSPHQISFEAGYRNIFSQIDRSVNPWINTAKHGVGGMIDYGWKVSGLNGKKPAVYLTIPLGYHVMYASNEESSNVSMLSYGWTVRHELFRQHSKVTPFVGYGLLLNTLKKQGVEGSVMGHQTQFELGTNFNTSGKLIYFAKVAYSYSSYPKIGDSKRIHLQYFDLKLGVRF